MKLKQSDFGWHTSLVPLSSLFSFQNTKCIFYAPLYSRLQPTSPAVNISNFLFLLVVILAGIVCMHVHACVNVCILPTTINSTPMKGRRVMFSEQQRATQEMMKATMRMRRPMIISAATAWAQAEVQHKHTN